MLCRACCAPTKRVSSRRFLTRPESRSWKSSGGRAFRRTIQERLGIEQANLSQHLAILRSRQIVVNRKEGNQVFYSLKNPVLLEVLDIMRRYFQANLTEAIQTLGQIEAETTPR